MLTREELYEEFKWLYPQIPAGEKRVNKYKRDYHRILESLDLNLWPDLREELKSQSFMPYPIKLEKLIFKLRPKNTNKSSYQESLPDCAKCAGTGFIPALEKKENYGWTEYSYACDCTWDNEKGW